MHGDRDNPDQEFACQSGDQTNCAIPASRADHETFSELHLYFHSTQTETKYSGVVTIGFFRGSVTAQEVKPIVTVKPGDIGNDSIVGIVTDKPGTQSVTIAIKAVSGAGVEQAIRERIPVMVQ
jgi:hypothetical protein